VVLDGHIAGERVTLTEIRARTPRRASAIRSVVMTGWLDVSLGRG
jgi:hypothetical protein